MNQIALYLQFCGMQPFSNFIHIRWEHEICQLWSFKLRNKYKIDGQIQSGLSFFLEIQFFSNSAHEKKYLNTCTNFAFKSQTHFPDGFFLLPWLLNYKSMSTYKIWSFFNYVLCWMHNLELWYYRNAKKKWSMTILPILAFYLQLDKVWGLSLFTHFFSRSLNVVFLKIKIKSY